MNYDNYKSFWKAEEAAAFKGWDFSHIDGRWESGALPWSYDSIVRKYLNSEHRLLDMGTGGGEYLLTLKHPHNLTCVTESYLPNVMLCQSTLAPLGIKVFHITNDEKLPFENESLDIVINRHESYSFSEVNRILKPGGMFITQQVGCENNNDLSHRLIKNFTPQFTKTFEQHLLLVQNAGYEVLTSAQFFPYIKFFDIGALVYFAKIIEWEFPGFTVDKSFDELCAFQQEIDEKGFVQGREHRFIIAARKGR